MSLEKHIVVEGMYDSIFVSKNKLKRLVEEETLEVRETSCAICHDIDVSPPDGKVFLGLKKAKNSLGEREPFIVKRLFSPTKGLRGKFEEEDRLTNLEKVVSKLTTELTESRELVHKLTIRVEGEEKRASCFAVNLTASQDSVRNLTLRVEEEEKRASYFAVNLTTSQELIRNLTMRCEKEESTVQKLREKSRVFDAFTPLSFGVARRFLLDICVRVFERKFEKQLSTIRIKNDLSVHRAFEQFCDEMVMNPKDIPVGYGCTVDFFNAAKKAHVASGRISDQFAHSASMEMIAHSIVNMGVCDNDAGVEKRDYVALFEAIFQGMSIDDIVSKSLSGELDAKCKKVYQLSKNKSKVPEDFLDVVKAST